MKAARLPPSAAPIALQEGSPEVPPVGWKRAGLAGRRWMQRAAFGLLWLAGLVAVAALAVIIVFVCVRGVGQVDLAFLTTPPRGGLSGAGGMSTTIVTTLLLVATTLSFAAPLGIGAAIYWPSTPPSTARPAAWGRCSCAPPGWGWRRWPGFLRSFSDSLATPSLSWSWTLVFPSFPARWPEHA